ncbi:hypothetical protein KDN24_06920 [Bacillus sp. Bva_UNVM-123]|uniref:hypothetical protein n=1 Tax=Bacillus sp. Bva_UNVM-123 TaxID=2829798 RepID=UPI00391F85F2
MGRLVKCPYCEKKLNKSESHEHKKRYYHIYCFETWQREGQDYKELMEYISELFKVEYPSLVIKKQIKDMKSEGYKYKGMELALRYFFETLDNRVQENTGVGIIPYIYEEAKRHYIKQKKIAESIQNLDSKESQEMIVYISMDKNRRKSKKIDISAI